MLINQSALTQFITAIYESAGASTTHAQTVAAHLVEANLKGHDSHGVGMTPTYVRNIKTGLLDVSAEAKVLKDSGAVLLVDGQSGFGQVVGEQATMLAVERAKQQGIACLGLRNAHHLGRIGHYGEMCGGAGLVSVHFVNVVGHSPQVSPWGGRAPRFTTNPFCATVPRKGQHPVVLDMATSAVALGKVRVAYHKGDAVPEGALVDHEGMPTTDPAVMYQEPFGALGPFGQHKGYGLAVICEMLGGALAGEWTAQPAHQRGHNVVNHMLMFVLDPAAFGGVASFQSEVDEMIRYLHETPPAKGFDRVRVPGEPEQESLTERSAVGIPIDDSSWQEILKAAEKAGLSQQQVDTLISG